LASSTSRGPDSGAGGAAGGRLLPVIVITGPSGAGKGTLIQALLGRIAELELAVSATTRLQRSGEEDGREYYFLSDGDFATRVARGDFLEHVTYVSGQRYGTLRSEVERIANTGRVAVLELETEGALNVADELSTAVTIFVTAPVRELERRLRERATESAGEIGERLDLAESQLTQADSFDYVVANDELERAVEELESIVRRELTAAGTMSGS
jgi:guanylate kinase